MLMIIDPFFVYFSQFLIFKSNYLKYILKFNFKLKPGVLASFSMLPLLSKTFVRSLFAKNGLHSFSICSHTLWQVLDFEFLFFLLLLWLLISKIVFVYIVKVYLLSSSQTRDSSLLIVMRPHWINDVGPLSLISLLLLLVNSVG